jgi:hypothetical protein
MTRLACDYCAGTGLIPTPDVMTIYPRTRCYPCNGTGDANARLAVPEEERASVVIAEIRDRLATATPGDWDVGRHPTESTHIRAYIDDGFGAYLTVCERVDDSAEFIAHAKADVEFLLAYIDRLERGIQLALEALERTPRGHN